MSNVLNVLTLFYLFSFQYSHKFVSHTDFIRNEDKIVTRHNKGASSSLSKKHFIIFAI